MLTRRAAHARTRLRPAQRPELQAALIDAGAVRALCTAAAPPPPAAAAAAAAAAGLGVGGLWFFVALALARIAGNARLRRPLANEHVRHDAPRALQVPYTYRCPMQL